MRILKPLLIAIYATSFVWLPASASANTDFNETKENVGFRIQSSFDRPVTLNSTLHTVTASTTIELPDIPDIPDIGDITLLVRLWVTVGQEAALTDPPREAGFTEGGGLVTTTLTTTFRLPTPGNPSPPPVLQSGVTAANLTGETIYVKLCLANLCSVDTFIVHPDKPTFIESPPLTEEGRATVYWEALPLDNGQPVGHGHRISFTNKNNPADSGSIYIPRQNDSQLVDYDGSKRNRLILFSDQANPGGFSPQPGEAYETSLQACGQANAICSDPLVIQNVTVFSSEFTASTGTVDSVFVDWVRHAPGTPQYTLERCVAGSSTSCTTLNVGSNATNYSDTSAVPGVLYRYTVYACPVNGLTCTGNLIPTGISNVGFRALETPNPAKMVTASDGTRINQIQASWSEFSPNAVNFSDPGYEVVITNPASPGNAVVRKVPYLVMQANTLLDTGTTLELPSGVLLSFAVRTCANLNTASPQCAESTTTDTGYAQARFTASSPSTGVARIDWVRFSPGPIVYRLERCTDTANPQCTLINVGNVLTYDDATATAGDSFVYSIYACSATQENSCVKTGDTNIVMITRPDTPNPATDVSASDGEPNRIDVTWSEFSPDASGFSDPGYLVEIKNRASSSDTIIVREIPYQPGSSQTTFVTGTNQDLPSGVLFEFNVRTCADFDSSSPSCANSHSGDTGFAFARFTSGSPRAGVAQIDWPRFSTDTARYRLERCLESSSSECVFINLQNITSFKDQNLTEGSRYRYSVYACQTAQDNECIKTGDTDFVTIVGSVQPDIYEDDDSPLELNQPNQTIGASVTQSRSFDTAEDQDWTRIVFGSGVREFDILTTSSLENLDTQLTLFDANGGIVACALNTPNDITGNARLRLPNLPAGEYFLRVEQQESGLILGPVENYTLSTTISISSNGSPIQFPDCGVVDGFPGNPDAARSSLMPIFQLLLLE